MERKAFCIRLMIGWGPLVVGGHRLTTDQSITASFLEIQIANPLDLAVLLILEEITLILEDSGKLMRSYYFIFSYSLFLNFSTYLIPTFA